jgi:hypothetical protein
MANQWRFSVLQFQATPMPLQTISDIKLAVVTDSGSCGQSGFNPGAEYTSNVIQVALFFSSDSLPGGTGTSYLTLEDITLATDTFGTLTVPAGTTLVKDGSGNFAYTWNGLSQTIPTGSWTNTINGTVSFNEVLRYTVNVTEDPLAGGTATVNGLSSVYDIVGTALTFVATPNAGYRFIEWQKGGIAAVPPATLLADETYTAIFEEEFTITTIADPLIGGTATVNGTTSVTELAGTALTFVATPNVKYQFIEWQKGGLPVIPPATVTESGDYTAIFEEEFTVTADTNDPLGGTATVNGTNSVTGLAGTVVAFVATPSVGYRFIEWQKGGIAAVPPAEISSDGDYIAIFAKEYTVSVSTNPTAYGSVTVNGAASVTDISGTVLTFVATPNEGFSFVEWQKDDAPVIPPATLTEDASYVAVFIADATTLPVLMLRWMNDNTGKWSAPRFISLGNKGDTTLVKSVQRLGSYETRQYELTWSDKVPVLIAIFEENVKGEEGQTDGN